jgi:arginyl-tRNA synthetase
VSKTVKQILKDHLVQATDDKEVDVLIPPDSKLGDYSTNAAFLLAKKEGKKPVDVANNLKEGLSKSELSKMFDVQVAPNGFLNFYGRLEFLQNKLGEINKDETFGQSEEGKDQKVIVEYSSTNIAKPAHIGHLRSMIIGDSLASVYEKLGYKVLRWDYIGDWGTQFGKVIAGYKKWGEGKKEVTMADMLEWYVKATKELPEDEGAKEFKKLETGDSENRKLWQQFKEASLGELDKTYKKLNLYSFDVIKG